jgi:predicted nucleic acid-binding protein
LHQVGLLSLLPVLYGAITIPTAVAQELQQGRTQGLNLPETETLSWLRIKIATGHQAISAASGLGPGEREVLALALATPDALVLLDDARARRHARSLNVAFTGTLGVLLRAKRVGQLAVIGPVVDQLDLLRFRLDPRTRRAILKLAGE